MLALKLHDWGTAELVGQTVSITVAGASHVVTLRGAKGLTGRDADVFVIAGPSALNPGDLVGCTILGTPELSGQTD